MDAHRTTRLPATLLLLGVCVGVHVAAARAFLPRQSVWLDEVTQLNGLTLDPAACARWLAGDLGDPFGCFLDRTPPASYWIGHAWSRAFGLTERSLRYFGLACGAAATVFVVLAAGRAWQRPAAYVAGMAFAVAPPVVNLAVEIRAYPLFLAATALTLWGVARWTTRAEGPRAADAAIVAAGLALAILTHFYGVVLGVAVLAGLAFAAGLRRSAWPAWAAVAVASALATLAIVPYLQHALEISRGRPDGVTRGLGAVLGLRRVVPGLTSHAALGASPFLRVLAPSAALGLLALAALEAHRRRDLPARTLFLALGAGLAVVAVAAVRVTGFDATRPIYNAWAWPLIALLLGAGVGHGPARLGLRHYLAILLLFCLGVGSMVLAYRGERYAHGPQRTVVRALATAARPAAVVYDSPSPHFIFLAAPLRHEVGESVPFLVPQGEGLARWAGVRRITPESGGVEVVDAETLFVVRTWPTSGALLSNPRKTPELRPAGPLERQLLASGRWRVARRWVDVGLDTCQVAVLERTDAAMPLQPSSPIASTGHSSSASRHASASAASRGWR
jgi:MYXO-CTERM domain-containing protein